MSLRETVDKMVNLYNKMKEENEYLGLTNLWFEINDVPLEEMRAAESENSKIYYSDPFKRMTLQSPFSVFKPTIFVRSKEVTVKEHVVIDDAYINV